MLKGGGRTDGRTEGRMEGRKDGRLEIPPCVLQDFVPFGAAAQKIKKKKEKKKRKKKRREKKREKKETNNGEEKNEKKEKSEKKASFGGSPIDKIQPHNENKIAELLFYTSQLGAQSNSKLLRQSAAFAVYIFRLIDHFSQIYGER